jgi:hypothetical protein
MSCTKLISCSAEQIASGEDQQRRLAAAEQPEHQAAHRGCRAGAVILQRGVVRMAGHRHVLSERRQQGAAVVMALRQGRQVRQQRAHQRMVGPRVGEGPLERCQLGQPLGGGRVALVGHVVGVAGEPVQVATAGAVAGTSQEATGSSRRDAVPGARAAVRGGLMHDRHCRARPPSLDAWLTECQFVRLRPTSQ